MELDSGGGMGILSNKRGEANEKNSP